MSEVPAQPEDPDITLIDSPEPTRRRKRKAEEIEVSSTGSSTDSSDDDSSSNARGSGDDCQVGKPIHYEPHQEQMLLVLKGIVNVSHWDL